MKISKTSLCFVFPEGLGITVNRKKRTDGEDARCDICGEPANLKRLRVKGKRVPDWYVVNKEKMIVRCKECKKKKLYSLKLQFRELIKRDNV